LRIVPPFRIKGDYRLEAGGKSKEMRGRSGRVKERADRLAVVDAADGFGEGRRD
jgi:hypothetical protein